MSLPPIFIKHFRDIEAIRCCVGKVVCSFSRDRYFFNYEAKDEDEGSLEISFSDSTFLTLRLANDGDSVLADTAALSIPEPFDIDEGARCTFKKVELTNTEPWAVFNGTRLVAADAVVDRQVKLGKHETISGWVLRFENGHFVTYLNCCDNAKITFDSLPPSVEGVETSLEPVFTQMEVHPSH